MVNTMHDNPDAQPVAITARLAAVRARIDAAATAAGRPGSDVRLLVATKTQSATAIRAAVLAGANLIGENRVQELTAKAPDIADLVAAGRVRVHMIGTLQRNKINPAVAAVCTIESVDTLALAEAISRRCQRIGRSLEIMIEVNVSGESAKSGVPPEDAAELAFGAAALPGLTLTGFMTIGANVPDADPVRAGFARLRDIRDRVVASGQPGTENAVELSMGMSSDLELAIAEGATIVRIGTAIFGPRK